MIWKGQNIVKSIEKIFLKYHPPFEFCLAWGINYSLMCIFFFENMYVEEMGDRPSNWLKLLLSLLLSWKDNLT